MNTNAFPFWKLIGALLVFGLIATVIAAFIPWYDILQISPPSP
jgi:hypothetical protein